MKQDAYQFISRELKKERDITDIRRDMHLPDDVAVALGSGSHYISEEQIKELDYIARNLPEGIDALMFSPHGKLSMGDDRETLPMLFTKDDTVDVGQACIDLMTYRRGNPYKVDRGVDFVIVSKSSLMPRDKTIENYGESEEDDTIYSLLKGCTDPEAELGSIRILTYRPGQVYKSDLTKLPGIGVLTLSQEDGELVARFDEIRFPAPKVAKVPPPSPPDDDPPPPPSSSCMYALPRTAREPKKIKRNRSSFPPDDPSPPRSGAANKALQW